ncbi:MAG: hypothetical protein ACR2QC_06955 [Gammaproteobacteria bacterium]
MAISRVKTWIVEVLTASDLNAEFDNIINNARSLISPLTGSLDMNGNEIILDADADSSITADTDDRIDLKLSGTDLFRFDGTATTPVNGLDFTAAAAGSEPSILARGSDTDIDITLTPKGAGVVSITGASTWQEISARTTASSDATVAFTWAGITYKMVVIQMNNVLPATDDVDLYIRTSTNGGSSYDSGAADYKWGVDAATRSDVSDAQIIANVASPNAVGNAAGEGLSGIIIVHDPANTARTTITTNLGYTLPSAAAALRTNAFGQRLSAADVDGVQFSFSSGNIASGEFIVWGVL